jgi:hypothetical protein
MAVPTGTKAPEELTPYEAVLRYFLYNQRVSAEDHLPTRTALERAVALQTSNADAWAALAMVFLDEDRHMFNPRPNALDRALQAAQCAVAADPANQLATFALAQAYYASGHSVPLPSAPSGSTGATATPWRWPGFFSDTPATGNAASS